MDTMINKRLISLAVEIGIALIIVAALIAYALSPVRLGVSRNWGAFLGETLIVFVNLFVFIRNNARPVLAWWLAIAALVIHIVGGTVICLQIEDIPLLWFGGAAVAEIVFLLGVIERIPKTRAGTQN